MKVVQIVVRSTSAEAVDIVERAFHATGLETNLITLGGTQGVHHFCHGCHQTSDEIKIWLRIW